LTRPWLRYAIGYVSDLKKFTRQLSAIRLRDDEAVADAWAAGIPLGRTSNGTKIGGTLALTSQRLIFQPLQLPTVMSPYDIDSWTDGSCFALELRSIRYISIDDGRRSAIVVTGPDGSMTLNVAASRWTTTFSKKNVAARDEALTTIGRAIQPDE
jgi:hypothetical protein